MFVLGLVKGFGELGGQTQAWIAVILHTSLHGSGITAIFHSTFKLRLRYPQIRPQRSIREFSSTRGLSGRPHCFQLFEEIKTRKKANKSGHLRVFFDPGFKGNLSNWICQVGFPGDLK